MALKLYWNIFRLYGDRQPGETKWEAKDGPLFKLPFQHVQTQVRTLSSSVKSDKMQVFYNKTWSFSNPNHVFCAWT